jgi:hypothetical protein
MTALPIAPGTYQGQGLALNLLYRRIHLDLLRRASSACPSMLSGGRPPRPDSQARHRVPADLRDPPSPSTRRCMRLL